MTPKEKAIELYNTYRNKLPVLAANVRAKKQALQHVETELATCVNLHDPINNPKTKFWNLVKTELKNLK